MSLPKNPENYPLPIRQLHSVLSRAPRGTTLYIPCGSKPGIARLKSLFYNYRKLQIARRDLLDAKRLIPSATLNAEIATLNDIILTPDFLGCRLGFSLAAFPAFQLADGTIYSPTPAPTSTLPPDDFLSQPLFPTPPADSPVADSPDIIALIMSAPAPIADESEDFPSPTGEE